MWTPDFVDHDEIAIHLTPVRPEDVQLPANVAFRGIGAREASRYMVMPAGRLSAV